MSISVLSITNGDSAAAVMAAAGVPGRILPWRDILHDGPVPGGLAPAGLAAVRAGFLAGPAPDRYEAILQDFQERDRLVQAFDEFRQVTIWLEHDLYDQLQLLQLLDRFADVDAVDTDLGLICATVALGLVWLLRPLLLAPTFEDSTTF